MPARRIPLPTPPPGGAATFTFEGHRRGWIATVPAPQLLASPAYSGGRVYVGGGFSSNALFGLDAKTGALDWTAQAPDGGPSAAIVTGGKVLFNTESCTIFCVDASTGRELWKRWLGDPMMSLPAAADGLVYAGHIAPPAYGLTALRVANGEVAWTRTLDADVLSAPVVAAGAVYVTTMVGSVYRFDARTGSETWSRALDATSAPWVERGRLYLSRRRPEGKEQQIVLDAGDGRIVGQGGELPAPYAAQRPDTGGVQAGWSYEGSRPVLADGRAYYSMGPEIRAKDLATGEVVWRRRVDAPAGRPLSPPAVVDGTIVIGTAAGDLYGIDVDTGLSTFAYRIGEPIAFQPVVANGWVYATTAGGHVVGLEVADASFDGWHMWGGGAAHTGAGTAGLDPLPPDAPAPTEGTLRAQIGSEKVPLPLERTDVHVRVSGLVARARVEQTFENPTDAPLDAVYLFPLPAEAAVDAMEMRIGDRVVQARIQKRAAAREGFEAARREGRTASLLEQERPNLFQQSVANVPAHGTVRVTLSYAAVLPFADGGYSLALPLVAPPRYGGAAAPASEETVRAFRPARAVSIEVDVDGATPIDRLASPSHEVVVRRRGAEGATVSLAAADRLPNRDFVLGWKVAGDAPRAALLSSASGGSGYFTLLVHPRAAAAARDAAPREVVLLLDASSSMRGAPLESERALARAILAGLDPRDTLRLVRFAERVESLDEDALAPSPEVLERARAFVDGMRASGGTELATAVEAALAPAAPADRVRTVILATDGWIGREEDVLATIAERLGDARLHTVGLGASPNRFLLERAAELGRGESFAIGVGDVAATGAADFARRIAQPSLTDVSVDWGGLAVRDVYPRFVPDLHADRPIVLVGRFEGEGRGTIRLRGKIGGRPWTASIEARLPRDARDHEALGSVWARARIHDLENALFVRDSDEIRGEIASVGLAHSLVTSETSFLAVDADRAELPAVPVARPGGGGGGGGEGGGSEGTYYSAPEDVDGSPDGVQYDFDDDSVGGQLVLPAGETVMTVGGGGGYGVAGVSVEGEYSEAPPEFRTPAFAPVEPTLTRSQVHRGVAAHASDVRRIYEEALRRRPGLHGRLVVEIVIQGGRVVSVTVTDDGVHDAELSRALVALVRTWTFEAGKTTTTYPFDFGER